MQGVAEIRNSNVQSTQGLDRWCTQGAAGLRGGGELQAVATSDGAGGCDGEPGGGGGGGGKLQMVTASRLVEMLTFSI
jgi:hypothetical protein